MGSHAPQVYSDPASIQRLEARVDDLADNAKVTIVETDGTRTTGIVTVLPTVQTFRDADGKEGVNGVVKLTDPTRPGWQVTLWLDRIEQVIHLDSVARGTSQT
ncbi:hypothetical protein FHW69_002513 [Luteibacter sp. Sphag1AF]|uniref:DUF3247 family protein n=1 Tax=Luteibacter sp. Sphag1AF TaxID=2587031 RepID=UPI0016083012|nr:DUF3247 family protein [Luteibacter sp. Sphag1AF]MBB3227881.1 hypothetical protein [Luteibacter sp. Sphag1AF]